MELDVRGKKTFARAVTLNRKRPIFLELDRRDDIDKSVFVLGIVAREKTATFSRSKELCDQGKGVRALCENRARETRESKVQTDKCSVDAACRWKKNNHAGTRTSTRRLTISFIDSLAEFAVSSTDQACSRE